MNVYLGCMVMDPMVHGHINPTESTMELSTSAIEDLPLCSHKR